MAFPILLAQANPALVSRWRIASGVTTGVTTAASVADLVARAKQLLPPGMLIEPFLYMAVAAAFVTGLPLFFFPRVVTVAAAQLGVAIGVMLLACAFAGAFPSDYQTLFRALSAIVACVLLMVFSGGLLYAVGRKSWSDLGAITAMLLAFAYVAVFCILHPLR